MRPFKLIYTPYPTECEGTIYGATVESSKGLMIVIDSNQDEQIQDHALRHELAHIILDHFNHPERPIEQIEAEADAYAAQMTDIEYREIMAAAIREDGL